MNKKNIWLMSLLLYSFFIKVAEKQEKRNLCLMNVSLSSDSDSDEGKTLNRTEAFKIPSPPLQGCVQVFKNRKQSSKFRRRLEQAQEQAQEIQHAELLDEQKALTSEKKWWQEGLVGDNQKYKIMFQNIIFCSFLSKCPLSNFNISEDSLFQKIVQRRQEEKGLELYQSVQYEIGNHIVMSVDKSPSDLYRIWDQYAQYMNISLNDRKTINDIVDKLLKDRKMDDIK